VNTREVELLLKAAKYEFPLPKESKEPIPTIPEVLDIIKKITNPNDKKLSEVLVRAVKYDHPEIVKALLQAKVNPNIPIPRPLLSYAAENGHQEMVQSFIAAKADINAMDFIGKTALFFSVASKNQVVIQSLLDAKANPNLKGENIDSPLTLACSTNQPDTIIRLINAGVKITKEGTSESEFDCLIRATTCDFNAPTPKQLEETLPVINLLLNQNALLNSPFGFSLYQYLRDCDQRNPLIEDSYIKLCQYLEKPCGDEKKDAWNKKCVLEPTRDYLKKLQAVMQYKEKKDYDYVSSSQVCNAVKVEELHKRICEELVKKRYPWLSYLGLAPTVQPDLEVQPSKKRTF
jgi:hypothetical protein